MDKLFRIYFAGKIGHNDWRCEIFGRDQVGGMNPHQATTNLLDPEYYEDRGF
jgi:hypothetical protein